MPNQNFLILMKLMKSRIFFFQAEDGIRDFCLSRGLGDVYKRQVYRVYTVDVEENIGTVCTDNEKICVCSRGILNG